jgi:WD40 repeat protein
MSIAVLLMLMAVSSYAQSDDVVWEKEYGVVSAKFSPDGTKIYASGGSNFYVLDATTGDVINQYEKKYGGIIAVSPDGQFLYTSKGYKLDANTFEIIKRQASYGESGLVATNKNCDVIVEGSTLDAYDFQRVAIVNPETMEEIRTIPGKLGGIGSIAVSPDGKSFATVSRDGNFNTNKIARLVLWSTETCEKIAVLAEEEPGNDPSNLTFSPDGTMLAATIDKNVVIFDIETLKPIKNIECITDIPMNSLTFSPDSKYLVYGTDYFTTGDTQIASINPCEMIYTYDDPIFSSSGVLVSPDSKYILSLTNSLFLLNANWEGVGIKDKETNILTMNVYPNPVEHQATIEYYLPTAGNVQIEMVSQTGASEMLFEGFKPLGNNQFILNTDAYLSGQYFVRLRFNGQEVTQNIIVVK